MMCCYPTVKRDLPLHCAHDSPLNFLRPTDGQQRINLYAKFLVLNLKMTAIMQIYILSPARIMTINHRDVSGVDNYRVNGW